MTSERRMMFLWSFSRRRSRKRYWSRTSSDSSAFSVGNVEGRHLRGRFHHELVRLDFDFASGKLGVDRVGCPQFHLAGHGYDGLEVRLFDEAEEAARGMDDDLREAVVVAEVHEEDSAVVAEAEHPARKPDSLARVRGAELIASVCTIRMHLFMFSY